MAVGERPHDWQETVLYGICNFNIQVLPPDRQQAIQVLHQHIRTLIMDHERRNGRGMVTFYIGKSSVPRHLRKNFDINRPRDTWNLDNINGRWRVHRNDGYDTMVVIGVISEQGPLPNGIRGHLAQHYLLSLEGELINRFRFDSPQVRDERIANQSHEPGTRAVAVYTEAYVLYVAMKLEPLTDPNQQQVDLPPVTEVIPQGQLTDPTNKGQVPTEEATSDDTAPPEVKTEMELNSEHHVQHGSTGNNPEHPIVIRDSESESDSDTEMDY